MNAKCLILNFTVTILKAWKISNIKKNVRLKNNFN